jgi:site-specific DNA-methyltransferase (adenine-specific)
LKTLLNKDCFEVLKDMRPVHMIFADPPDNIGLGYSDYKDNMPEAEYRKFMRKLIWGSTNKCDVLWLSHNAIHTCMVGSLMYDFLGLNAGWEFKACVQTYTFYQQNKNDLGVAHRPLLRLMKTGAPLYPDAVKVPSWRQLNGDKRAAPGGKVPGTVFDFPRVVGNSKQRRAYHPTQLHEGLYERCIKLCCQEGDTVCDLFAGTGTLARVADRCGINALMIEIDKGYCERIAEEHDLELHDD